MLCPMRRPPPSPVVPGGALKNGICATSCPDCAMPQGSSDSASVAIHSLHLFAEFTGQPSQITAYVLRPNVFLRSNVAQPTGAVRKACCDPARLLAAAADPPSTGDVEQPPLHHLALAQSGPGALGCTLGRDVGQSAVDATVRDRGARRPHRTDRQGLGRCGRGAHDGHLHQQYRRAGTVLTDSWP